MNANQLFFLGVVLVTLAVLPAYLWGFSAYALESRYDSRAIFGAGQYEKDMQHSGIQLIARSKAGQAQPGAEQVTTGGSGGASQSVVPKRKVLETPFASPRCWQQCTAQGGDQKQCTHYCGGARPPQTNLR